MTKLTAADHQRNYRERQKQKAIEANRAAAELFTEPFFEFFRDAVQNSDFHMMLDLIGVEPPTFDDDRGPEHYVLDKHAAGLFDAEKVGQYGIFGVADNSLGRAETMIGHFTDAARALAEMVNRFKVSIIEKRLDEIASQSLSDPAEKKQAIAEAARLTKMREQLSKTVRVMHPEWKVAF